MINFDNYVNENKTEHNKNQPLISDDPALTSNDDKRLQTSDKITTYPYGTDKMMMINK